MRSTTALKGTDQPTYGISSTEHKRFALIGRKTRQTRQTRQTSRVLCKWGGMCVSFLPGFVYLYIQGSMNEFAT